jgi:phospholipase/lecithinase/hemolysin
VSNEFGFSTIYAFGDSLSDAGNIYTTTTALGTPEPVSPPYFRESYSVAGPIKTDADVFSNGPTWVQDLSLSLGMGTLEPSTLGGTDYAFGGAETGSTPQNAGNLKVAAISLPAQLALFEAEPGTPSPTALYTLWIGGNDIFDILADPSLTPTQQDTDVTDAVNNEMHAVNELVHDGAKDMLVVDVPDLGKVPEVTLGLANGSDTPSAALDTLASTLATDYNAQLNADLDAIAKPDALNLHILDAYQVIDNAVADPSAFDLTNVTDPVWSGNFTSASSGTLAVTGAAQEKYLFFDDFHPTETGHSVIAAAAQTALAGPVACYRAGTPIRTDHGEVRIEALRVGDRVASAFGGVVPVIWIGHRRLDCRRHPRAHEIWPVRIAAHALGTGRPCRDLWLSPDHAVHVDGVLIPIRTLINGVTVVQEPIDSVTYFHLELPQHDVIFAAGLPAESYLDTGNRFAFENGGPARALHPDFAQVAWNAAACAPQITHGPIHDAVVARLRACANRLPPRTVPANGYRNRPPGTRHPRRCADAAAAWS